MDGTPTPSIPVPGGNGDGESSGPQTAGASSPPEGSTPDWWGLPHRDRPNDRRLLELITPYDQELASRSDRETPAPPWLVDARQMLDRAKELAVAGEYDAAWNCFLTATRREIDRFDDAELLALAVALESESNEKLKSWRGKAVQELLKTNGTDPPPSLNVRRFVLMLATWIRDEDSRNRYRRIRELRKQLLVLGGVLVAGLVALLGLVLFLPLDLTRVPAGAGKRIWVWVMVFGLLGGCLSAFRSVISRSTALRLPEQISLGLLTAVRPLLGVTGAVAAFAFLQSGLLQLNVGTSAIVLAVAFAAGFTERLVTRAVDSLLKQ